MRNLLLTLGHNSSAILVEDDRVVWGYETERITGVKSDSRFPSEVLRHKRLDPRTVDCVYVTHWDPACRLDGMSAKHWDPKVFDGCSIRTLTVDTSHHDTHVYAAMAYAGKEFCSRDGCYGLVVDGFGSFGEHLSVYRFTRGKPKLVRRVHGYGTSLGLWYQYATAFMGMKMHEDEYKLLGYEAYVMPSVCRTIDTLVKATADEWLDRMSQSIYTSSYDPMYDLNALANVKAAIFSHLKNVCVKLGITDPTVFEARAMLAKYVQGVLETVVLKVIEQFPVKHLLCSGGVFYNVKLNRRLVARAYGQVCVYPLAGDQGNAIGLYYHDYPDFEFPHNLNWGVRDLKSLGQVPGLHIVDSVQAAANIATDQLTKVGYVNLVRGNMEFGPRAMCNTSTLARPTKASVEAINAANNRNTVMPMAPVMTRDMYENLFYETDKVWRSENHMIVALEYKDYMIDDRNAGVAHQYVEPTLHWTGRPQVVGHDDWLLNNLLNHFRTPLINTSFNYHGHPIAYDMQSVIKNHVLQNQRNHTFETIVLDQS